VRWTKGSEDGLDVGLRSEDGEAAWRMKSGAASGGVA